MDFDETRLYYSHQQLQVHNTDNNDDEAADDEELRGAVARGDNEEDTPIDLNAVRRHFREFLRRFCPSCLVCIF